MRPREIRRWPRSSASVVLPAPPTVTLPQQITGTGACQPGRAMRCAVTAAVTAESGAQQARQHAVLSPEARGMQHLHHQLEQGSGGTVRQVLMPLYRAARRLTHRLPS